MRLETKLNRINSKIREAQEVMRLNMDAKGDAFCKARHACVSLLNERQDVMRNAAPVERDAYLKGELHKCTPAGRREAGIKY